MKKKELKKVILNLFPKNKGILAENSYGVKRRVRPIFYVQYYGSIVQYVGQSIDLYLGRPFRACNSSYAGKYPVTHVEWRDACSDYGTRLYWEAVLIVKLKPKQQNWKKYKAKVVNTNAERERKKMRKRYMTRPLKDFIKNYEEKH